MVPSFFFLKASQRFQSLTPFFYNFLRTSLSTYFCIKRPFYHLLYSFGEVNATTQRLPIEANGDRDLVDRLSKLPIDNQPFWLINWQALEAHRENPQTYPQKPNPFLDPPQSTGNLGNSNLANSASVNSGNTGNASAADAGTLHGNNSISGNLNSASTNTPILANKNSFIADSASKSANGNAAVSNKAGNVGSAVLEDRFSGGIEPNRYFENQNIDTKGSGSSNYEPGNTVNVNY